MKDPGSIGGKWSWEKGRCISWTGGKMGENVSLVGGWNIRWFMDRSIFFLPYNARSCLGKGEGRAGVMWGLEGKSKEFKHCRKGRRNCPEDVWTLLGSQLKFATKNSWSLIYLLYE